jgi:hypothetical protein
MCPFLSYHRFQFLLLYHCLSYLLFQYHYRTCQCLTLIQKFLFQIQKFQNHYLYLSQKYQCQCLSRKCQFLNLKYRFRYQFQYQYPY